MTEDDPLPTADRIGLERLRRTRSLDRVPIIAQAGSPSEDPNAVIELADTIRELDEQAELRLLPLIGSVACSLLPADVLQLADHPSVTRITMDAPADVAFDEDID